MGLVLNVRDKRKDIAVAVDGDLAALVVHNGAGAVVVILDHAEGRHMLQRCAAQGLPDRADLSPAAVDEQQVGQRRKLVLRAVRLLAAAGHLVLRRAAGERLCQRGVVIGARDGFHLKAAVARAVGLAVLKDDHAADARPVAPVGNIVAFNHAGRLFQAQHLRSLLKQLFLAGIAPALAAQTLDSVCIGHRDELRDVAALGHVQLHLRAARLVQSFIQCLRVGRQGVHGNRFRDRLAVEVILRQKFLPHGVDVRRVAEQELPLVGQASVTIAQHGGADRVGRARQCDDVHLGVALHDDLLPGCHAVNGHDLVAQQRRRLKVKPLRRSLHLLPQLPDDVLFAVADHPQCALHSVVVSSTGDFAAAHGHALADVGVEAGAALAEILRKVLIAPRQQEAVLRRFHHLPHGKRRGERADVVGVVVILLQRGGDARPGPARDLDIAVALVVFQQNIVLRRMGLDLAGLEDERLKFRLTDNDVKREGVGDHLADLGVVGHALPEILRHAGFQALGLADIDDRVRLVPDDVDAGQQRQHTGLFIKFSFCHGVLPFLYKKSGGSPHR